MLKNLILKNFVIVDYLDLDFRAGFGILTGETGAGKSILIDAITLLIGARSDGDFVRSGCEKAEISGEFIAAPDSLLWEWLRELEFAQDDQLIIRRVIDANGKSRAWINGSSASLQQCRTLGEFLLDIHGQHAHQNLLKNTAQRDLLDEYAGNRLLLQKVSATYSQWQLAVTNYHTAKEHNESSERELEQLRWQIDEVEALAFSPEEWQELEIEHKRLAHAHKLIDSAQFALQQLSENDLAAGEILDKAQIRLANVAEYDVEIDNSLKQLEGIQSELNDLCTNLRRYCGRIDLDPERLQQVEQRISAIDNILRKYRCLPEDLPIKLAAWQDRLQQLQELSDIASLQKKVETTKSNYLAACKPLSDSRKKAAKNLEKLVSEQMQQIALANGKFSVVFTPLENGSSTGSEQLEFYISGLAGSEKKPLAKVVSGGELSRISLALQVVTAQSSSVATLIFDEVDVGIGGGVAEVVGKLMHDLGNKANSKVQQILCVTHLPQVAAKADWQFKISKINAADQIVSQVKLLDDNQRVEEIARMLGGIEITATTLQHARELLGYK